MTDLWGVLITGPRDLHPFTDKAEADKLAEDINSAVERGWLLDDVGEAKVIPWPFKIQPDGGRYEP